MFQFVNNKGQPVAFSLTAEGVRVARPDEAIQTVRVDALIGVTLPAPVSEDSEDFGFEFRYFLSRQVPYGKFGFATLTERAVVVLALSAPTPVKAVEFREGVLRTLYGADPNGFRPRHKDSGEVYYKKACVLINPKSGKGNAEALWAFVRPSLLANGVWPVEVVSRFAGHTVEYIRTLPLEELVSFDFFLCVSGDGTPSELINSFMHRPDVDPSLHRLTLQQLPAGSGCALSENNMKHAGSKSTLENVIHSCAHLRRHPHPLMEYQLLRGDGQTELLYGFMTAQYGFLADVDIESEFLRFMGWYRFDAYGALRVMVPTAYDIRVLVATGDRPSLPPVDQEVQGDAPDVEELAGDVYSLYLSSIEYLSMDYFSSPALRGRPGWLDLQLFPTRLGRVKFIKYLLRHKDYKVPNSIGLDHRLTKELRVEFRPRPGANDPLFVVDGESLRDRRLRAVQVRVSDRVVSFMV